MTPPEFRTNEPLDPVAWVPLSDLAAHGFGSGFDGRETIEQRIETLQRELAEDVLLDDIGMPHVPRSLARQLFAERTSARAE